MSSNLPPCRKVTVFAFRGDRTPRFTMSFLKKLDDERHGLGPGPHPIECLLFAGHAGVSVDGGATILGFNPDGGGIPVWRLMDGLKNGDAFPGIVRDDTLVFLAARSHPLPVRSFEVILPDPYYQQFVAILGSSPGPKLDDGSWQSNYSYGFPNGDGDCNCITWLERMGLPLLTGRMQEFIGLPGFLAYPSRRFGACV